MSQCSPPSPSSLLCSPDLQYGILALERDSQSAELQCYQGNVGSGSRADLPASTPLAPDMTTPTPLIPTQHLLVTEAPSSSTALPAIDAAMPSARDTVTKRRGLNWSGLDRFCFIRALDNHNPWIETTHEEVLSAWNAAVEETNRALASHKREARVAGGFEAQWQRMLKDVREQKRQSLKATGANFDEDDAYSMLYHLVEVNTALPLKLAFLKPFEPSPSPSSQLDQVQKQKRKQAVNAAREAGQTGQTLALQRLRDQHLSLTSDSTGTEGHGTATEMDEDDEEQLPSSLGLASPTQKKRKTTKTQHVDALVKTLDHLVDLQATVLSQSGSHRNEAAQSPSQEVTCLKDQVSQLQMDMADINSMMDAVLNMFMQQGASGSC